MSGASWKVDPALMRPAHKWKAVSMQPFLWGVSVKFACENPGCLTTLYMPCRPESTGQCFDTERAIQLTDRDGNPCPEAR